MIYGIVNGQFLKFASNIVAAETNMMLTAKFTFTKEWDQLIKIAYFRKAGSETYPFMLDDDCIPESAKLNLTEGDWEISIRGYDLRDTLTAAEIQSSTAPKLTTNIAQLHVWETVPLGDAEFEIKPQTLGEQILAVARKAEATAENVEARANAGEFNGAAGPKGDPGKDGYTPVKGVDYFDGAPGPKGDPGDKGDPGTSASVNIAAEFLGLKNAALTEVKRDRLSGIKAFISEMNRLAEYAGITHSVYRTPNGWPALTAKATLNEEYDPALQSVTCAEDVVRSLILARHLPAAYEALNAYSINAKINGVVPKKSDGKNATVYHSTKSEYRWNQWERRPDLLYSSADPYNDAAWYKSSGEKMTLEEVQKLPEVISMLACKGGSLSDGYDEDPLEGILNYGILCSYKGKTYALATIGIENNDPEGVYEDDDLLRGVLYDMLQRIEDGVPLNDLVYYKAAINKYPDISLYAVKLTDDGTFADDIARIGNSAYQFSWQRYNKMHSAASVTKIMAANVAAVYYKDIDVKIAADNLVKGSYWKIDGARAVKSGDTMTLHDALTVAMLASDNALTMTVADAIGGRMGAKSAVVTFDNSYDEVKQLIEDGYTVTLRYDSGEARGLFNCAGIHTNGTVYFYRIQNITLYYTSLSRTAGWSAAPTSAGLRTESKSTAISSASTDSQLPSAKAVYIHVNANIEEVSNDVEVLRGLISSSLHLIELGEVDVDELESGDITEFLDTVTAYGIYHFTDSGDGFDWFLRVESTEDEDCVGQSMWSSEEGVAQTSYRTGKRSDDGYQWEDWQNYMTYSTGVMNFAMKAHTHYTAQTIATDAEFQTWIAKFTGGDDQRVLVSETQKQYMVSQGYYNFTNPKKYVRYQRYFEISEPWIVYSRSSINSSTTLKWGAWHVTTGV